MNTYQPLLTDVEISQRKAEHEEALCASLAAQAPAEHVYLVKRTDGTERLIVGKSCDELPVLFGGCGCNAGHAVCNCGMSSWLDPIKVRSEPDPPSERSWVLNDAVLAVVLVAVIAALVLGVL